MYGCFVRTRVILVCLGVVTPLIDAAQADDAVRSRATRRFAELHPGASVYEKGGRIARVYGVPFSFGDNPEDSAGRFRDEFASVFGLTPGDLAPRSPAPDGRHAQPLMYDSATGQYKFTLVYYAQVRNGVPVFRSDLRLLVRNTPGSPLVLAASTLRDIDDFAFTVDVNAVRPDVGHGQARAAVPGLVDFTQPEPVIWAGIDDAVAAPTAAVTFVGHSPAPARWLFVVNATTGAVLYNENLIVDVDVTGNVSGLATTGSASEQCAAEVSTPMPYARATIGGTIAFSDVFGDFVIPNGGSSNVTVESRVRGEWFQVFNWLGADSVLSQTVAPPGPADFTHNPSNTEQVRAEVNAYIHANYVRDLTIAQNPSYPTLNQTEFPVYVNRTDGFCPGNAWYDPGDQSINFCLSGSGFPNTAWATVVHHEYGHRMVNAAGSGQGAYGEGTGDVMAQLVTDESETGIGFFGDCGGALRDANNSLQYPCDAAANGIHFCGQLLSGCVWDTRNELLLTNPATYRDIISNLAVNAILLHSGSGIDPTITIDYLTLDDDDADLGNGTPHSTEIEAGFDAHNMLPTPPATNGTCDTAIDVCPGSVSGSTVGVPNDGSAGCGASNSTPDVWYRYTPDANGVATASLCSGTSYDSVISVHTACPGSSGNQVDCDDDGCGDVGGPSTVTFSVTTGNAYLIRITGWNGSVGLFTLNVSGPACVPGCSVPADCDDGNPCTTDSCPGGVCQNANNSDPCNDGDSCTQTDACQGGSCVGTNPVVCTAQDQCHEIGACDTVTGACSNPVSPNGTGCNDGDACTQTDTCQTGACTGANPVVCTAQDQCHEIGACDTGTGVCSNPASPNGSGCDDGDACTADETCLGGVCGGGVGVVCDDLNPCTIDTCDTGAGCVSTPGADGANAGCDDGIACTSDECEAGGCVNFVATEGTACDGGDTCPGPASCDGGGFCHCEVPPIPTVSQWGGVVMTLLLLGAGTVVFGRRVRRRGTTPPPC